MRWWAAPGTSRPASTWCGRPWMGRFPRTVAGQAQPVLVVAPGAFGMGHVARLAGALEAAGYRRMRMGGLVAWRNRAVERPHRRLARVPGRLPPSRSVAAHGGDCHGGGPGAGPSGRFIAAAIAAVDDEIRAARIVIVGPGARLRGHGLEAWPGVDRRWPGRRRACGSGRSCRPTSAPGVHARLPAAMTGTSESAVVRFPATGLSVAV